jgi:hypothetical protein
MSDVTKGFAKLKAGCIHLECPACGRKMSNVPRCDWDPPDAVLAVLLCDKSKCSAGCKDSGADYYDANGIELSADPDDWKDTAQQ